MSSTKPYSNSSSEQLSKEEQEALLAAAIEQARNDSGANALPPAEFFQDPVLREQMPATSPMDVSTMQVVATMNAAAREQAMARPQDAPGFNTTMGHDERQLAQAFSTPAPVAVSFGGQVYSVPASVRSAPNELHVRNPGLAKQLWKYFLPDSKLMAELAALCAKKGFDTKPLVFFSPSVFCALEFDGIILRKEDDDAEFAETEKDKSSQQYTALLQCFGHDNARLLMRECERGNISVRSAIQKIAKHLLNKYEAEKAQIESGQTVNEWSK